MLTSTYDASLRPERGRADQRDHRDRAPTASQDRRTSSCETALSTLATTLRRRTSPHPTTIAISWAARWADRWSGTNVLLCRLRADVSARRYHQDHQCADACGTDRRFFADAVQSSVQFPLRSAISGRRDPRRAFKARSAERLPRSTRLPNRGCRLRTTFVADAPRRPRSGGSTDRPAVGRRRDVDRPLQLQRSASVRSVCRSGVRAGSGLRHGRAAARTERSPSPSRTCRRRGFVNDLRFGYNRVSIGVFAENTSTNNASVGLPALSAKRRATPGLSVISIAGYSPLGHEYTTPQESTSDTFQPVGHGDVVERTPPDEGWRRVVRRSSVGVSRRAVPRVSDLRQSGLHGERARGSAPRTAGADRRRAARQSAEPARADAGASSHRTTGGRRRR